MAARRGGGETDLDNDLSLDEFRLRGGAPRRFVGGLRLLLRLRLILRRGGE